MWRRLSYYICQLALSMALVSCGDFWSIDTADLSNDTNMALTRRIITIMEGERYAIPVQFSPDTLVNRTIFWDSEDDHIATFRNDSPGLTRIVATSAVHLQSDTCWVQVLPTPEMDWGDFPYEMLLYASVTLHGTPLTVANQDSVVIAAYADKDLRGVGQVRHAHGIDYFVMRIGAYRPSGDTLRLRCYYRGKALAEWFPQTLTFDGNALGTLSNLYPLTLNEGAEVYLPEIEEPEGTNPYIVVPDTIINVVTD